MVGYNTKEPLINIDEFQIFSGEVVVLTGVSGIGKTTLLKTIAGLVKPINGTVNVCDRKLPSKPKRGEIGYIPQSLGLVRHASVIHNVMIGANAGMKKFWNPIPSLLAKDVADKAISAMDLTSHQYRLIRKLSGGQQRRVATARTLAQRPRLILADEFLSELDDNTKEKVLSEVLKYVQEENAALVVIEHDIKRAREMGDRIFLIKERKIIEIDKNIILEEE